MCGCVYVLSGHMLPLSAADVLWHFHQSDKGKVNCSSFVFSFLFLGVSGWVGGLAACRALVMWTLYQRRHMMHISLLLLLIVSAPKTLVVSYVKKKSWFQPLPQMLRFVNPLIVLLSGGPHGLVCLTLLNTYWSASQTWPAMGYLWFASSLGKENNCDFPYRCRLGAGIVGIFWHSS